MAWLQDLIQCLALDVYTLGLEAIGDTVEFIVSILTLKS